MKIYLPKSLDKEVTSRLEEGKNLHKKFCDEAEMIRKSLKNDSDHSRRFDDEFIRPLIEEEFKPETAFLLTGSESNDEIKIQKAYFIGYSTAVSFIEIKKKPKIYPDVGFEWSGVEEEVKRDKNLIVSLLHSHPSLDLSKIYKMRKSTGFITFSPYTLKSYPDLILKKCETCSPLLDCFSHGDLEFFDKFFDTYSKLFVEDKTIYITPEKFLLMLYCETGKKYIAVNPQKELVEVVLYDNKGVWNES